eukprot:scaffold28009_cov55-Phaeocystis_antarctica.AAC.5
MCLRDAVAMCHPLLPPPPPPSKLPRLCVGRPALASCGWRAHVGGHSRSRGGTTVWRQDRHEQSYQVETLYQGW